MADVIKPRRGTAAHWTSSNPILAENEIGRETDTGRWKIGVADTHWNDLPYESFGRAIEEITDQTSASYQVQLTDVGKTIECDNADANDLTLPTDEDVAVPVNANMAAFWKGVGQPTVFAETGAKLNGIPSGVTKISQRYGRIWIRKSAVDEWYIGGDMTGVIPPNSGGDITVITILGVTYILHRFLVNDDLVLTIPITNADWLLVAGGGGGGSSQTSYGGGGGGGAGGLLEGSGLNLSIGTYPVVIGAGGAGGLIGQSQQGTDGGNSSFNGNTAVGGGGGGNGAHNANSNGRAGGSGGGGGWYGSTGGAGTSGQGYEGGESVTGGDAAGGGGGGAGGAGNNSSGGTPGAGGAGLTRSLDGNSVEYAKGGTGGENFTAPVANTGSGGYGAYAAGAAGATGAGGILLLRYQA